MSEVSHIGLNAERDALEPPVRVQTPAPRPWTLGRMLKWTFDVVFGVPMATSRMEAGKATANIIQTALHGDFDNMRP